MPTYAKLIFLCNGLFSLLLNTSHDNYCLLFLKKYTDYKFIKFYRKDLLVVKKAKTRLKV